jgi:hypothetical protein
MPIDVNQASAFNILKNLESQSKRINIDGKDSLKETNTKLPDIVRKRNVTQDSSGKWDAVDADDPKPFSSPSSRHKNFIDEIDDTINQYKKIIRPFDENFYNINQEINSKKSLIVSLINTAVSSGCTYSVGDAGNIGGVACGIGSTIYNDSAFVSYYPNLTKDSSPGSKIFKVNTELLEPALFTKGFQNSFKNNSGSMVGLYYTISTDPNAHLFPFNISFPPLSSSQANICAGYGSSILSIAQELIDLRSKRNSILAEVNSLKEDKTSEEVVSWGATRNKKSNQSAKKRLNKQINNIRKYLEDIVSEDLIIHLNSTKSYGVQYYIENTTGVGIVSSFINLSNEASSPDPINKPNYVGFSGNDTTFTVPSISLNGINQYFVINKEYINDPISGIPDGDTSYSIESWFKVSSDSNLSTSPTDGGSTIVGINSIHGIGLQVYKPSSGLTVNFGSRGSGSIDSGQTLSLNTWYHVVAVREQNVNSRIYINSGISSLSSTSGLDIITTPGLMQIGYAGTHIGQYFSGNIGIIRIYKKALSDAEVLRNYEADKIDFGHS